MPFMLKRMRDFNARRIGENDVIRRGKQKNGKTIRRKKRVTKKQTAELCAPPFFLLMVFSS